MIDRQKQSSLDSTKINYFKQFWNSLTSCCRCKSVNWRKTDENRKSTPEFWLLWCGLRSTIAVWNKFLLYEPFIKGLYSVMLVFDG